MHRNIRNCMNETRHNELMGAFNEFKNYLFNEKNPDLYTSKQDHFLKIFELCTDCEKTHLSNHINNTYGGVIKAKSIQPFLFERMNDFMNKAGLLSLALVGIAWLAFQSYVKPSRTIES